MFVSVGYVTNKANGSFDLEAIRNLLSQEYRLNGFLIPMGTIYPHRTSGYFMYYVDAGSNPLFYVHILNSRFV
jgi:hypothetical protein